MELAQQVAAIALVFGLMAAALWALRRRGLVSAGWTAKRASAGQRMSIIDRLPLTPQHTLHLLELDGRTYLIATHAGGCTLLAGSGTAEASR